MPAKINVELENVHKLIVSIKADLEGKATTAQLELLISEIRAKDKRIEVLESQVAILQNSVKLLTSKCDDNEQYSRRTSVRISNIPLPASGPESADDVMEKVKEVIQESKADITFDYLDRAHRVGKPFICEDGSRKQQIIVKFLTWHHRTLLYRNRKKLSSAKIHLDLTQSKFRLLKKSQEKVKDDNRVDFAFADVNCALCVRLKDGKFKYFSSEEQLDSILSNILFFLFDRVLTFYLYQV